MSNLDLRKERFVALVEAFTHQLLAAQPRRHASCVAPALGPSALARAFRPDRLPTDERDLTELAERLARWTLGLAPDAERPYSDADIAVGS